MRGVTIVQVWCIFLVILSWFLVRQISRQDLLQKKCRNQKQNPSKSQSNLHFSPHMPSWLRVTSLTKLASVDLSFSERERWCRRCANNWTVEVPVHAKGTAFLRCQLCTGSTVWCQAASAPSRPRTRHYVHTHACIYCIASLLRCSSCQPAMEIGTTRRCMGPRAPSVF